MDWEWNLAGDGQPSLCLRTDTENTQKTLRKRQKVEKGRQAISINLFIISAVGFFTNLVGKL